MTATTGPAWPRSIDRGRRARRRRGSIRAPAALRPWRGAAGRWPRASPPRAAAAPPAGPRPPARPVTEPLLARGRVKRRSSRRARGGRRRRRAAWSARGRASAAAPRRGAEGRRRSLALEAAGEDEFRAVGRRTPPASSRLRARARSPDVRRRARGARRRRRAPPSPRARARRPLGGGPAALPLDGPALRPLEAAARLGELPRLRRRGERGPVDEPGGGRRPPQALEAIGAVALTRVARLPREPVAAGDEALGVLAVERVEALVGSGLRLRHVAARA